MTRGERERPVEAAKPYGGRSAVTQDEIKHKRGKHRHLSGQLFYATTVFD